MQDIHLKAHNFNTLVFACICIFHLAIPSKLVVQYYSHMMYLIHIFLWLYFYFSWEAFHDMRFRLSRKEKHSHFEPSSRSISIGFPSSGRGRCRDPVGCTALMPPAPNYFRVLPLEEHRGPFPKCFLACRFGTGQASTIGRSFSKSITIVLTPPYCYPFQILENLQNNII